MNGAGKNFSGEVGYLRLVGGERGIGGEQASLKSHRGKGEGHEGAGEMRFAKVAR